MGVSVDLNSEDCSQSPWLPGVDDLVSWLNCALETCANPACASSGKRINNSATDSANEGSNQSTKSTSSGINDSARNNTTVNVSIRLVDTADAASLNREYRGKDKPTNVLSFPAQLPETVTKLMEYTHLGDIVMCPHVVEKEARDQRKQLQAHWAHMAIHGFLHLQGYDHDSSDDAQVMEVLEIRTLEKLGFSNPYLIG